MNPTLSIHASALIHSSSKLKFDFFFSCNMLKFGYADVNKEAKFNINCVTVHLPYKTFLYTGNKQGVH